MRALRWVLTIAAVAALGGWWLARPDPYSVDEFCREWAELTEQDEASLEINPLLDGEVRAALDRTAEQVEQIVDVAPPGIQADISVLAGLLRALSEAVAATDSREFIDRAAALRTAQAPYLEQQQSVVTRINAYVARNCVAAPR